MTIESVEIKGYEWHAFYAGIPLKEVVSVMTTQGVMLVLMRIELYSVARQTTSYSESIVGGTRAVPVKINELPVWDGGK